jgi:hypothetical protein
MEISDFVQKKCNSGKNIQFKPRRITRLDLGKVASLLEKENALLEVETDSLLIFSLDKLQIDLNSTCKTVVKTEIPEVAKKAFQRLLLVLKNSAKAGARKL